MDSPKTGVKSSLSLGIILITHVLKPTKIDSFDNTGIRLCYAASKLVPRASLNRGNNKWFFPWKVNLLRLSGLGKQNLRSTKQVSFNHLKIELWKIIGAWWFVTYFGPDLHSNFSPEGGSAKHQQTCPGIKMEGCDVGGQLDYSL